MGVIIIDSDEIQYGFYSLAAVRSGAPTAFYSTPTGKVVEVTIIDTDPLARDYLWEDKVFLGPVDEFLRSSVEVPGLILLAP